MCIAIAHSDDRLAKSANSNAFVCMPPGGGTYLVSGYQRRATARLRDLRTDQHRQEPGRHRLRSRVCLGVDLSPGLQALDRQYAGRIPAYPPDRATRHSSGTSSQIALSTAKLAASARPSIQAKYHITFSFQFNRRDPPRCGCRRLSPCRAKSRTPSWYRPG